MKYVSVQITHKGQEAIRAYKEGRYSDANLSEMEFAMLCYANSIPTWHINDSIVQYGTEGSAAIDILLEEGKLSYKRSKYSE